MIKKIGIGLILVSITMLIFYFIYNFSLEKKNNDDVAKYIEITSIQEEEIVEPEVEKEENKVTYQIDYTAILEIPSINFKRGVVNNTKNFNSINYAVSVDNNSNYPNEYGNFILYAHSGNSSIGFFNKLVDMNLNDDVYVYYNGVKYHYLIQDKYDIEKTGKAKVLSSKTDKYITMITCNQKRKGYQIVLIGKLVGEELY